MKDHQGPKILLLEINAQLRNRVSLLYAEVSVVWVHREHTL